MEYENEYEELKGIVEDYLLSIRDDVNEEDIKIISARREKKHWKIVVRYSTDDYVDIISVLLINRRTKEVDAFRENIDSY